jgi:hypothetical protein
MMLLVDFLNMFSMDNENIMLRNVSHYIQYYNSKWLMEITHKHINNSR